MTTNQNPHSGLALGLALGMAVGLSLGVALDDLALWLALGAALGLVFGLSYDQQQKKNQQQVKIVDGATYTIAERDAPRDGQRAHYWLGDNGAELELSDEEAARLGLG